MTGKHILVVEDNQLNLELVTDLLEANGFIVIPAATAEEGLRLTREAVPDLVLMDLTLPGIDGLVATQLLKSDPTTRHVPVVALTARAMKGDEAMVLGAGCDGYLTKPIDTRALSGVVSHFIAAANPTPNENEIVEEH